VSERTELNRQIIEEFRAHRGQVGGPYDGIPLLLLTIRGARTGTRYTRPVMYLADGDDLVVFGANGGRAAHPGWYHNLMAAGEATVEVGTELRTVSPRVATGTERDRLWARQLLVFPGLDQFQTGIDRLIPVVVLQPRD
jgi:deazaflavin-dependent oxidoreductase (nitroreductase family)